MAAPTTTARSAPGGIRLDDGYSSKIAFARDPDVSFWEKTVTGAGIDGGDPIDTTTMHNTTVTTKAAQALYDIPNAQTTVAYDPAVYTQIQSLVNQEGSITEHFPDGSTLSYYGYLKSFAPAEKTRGTQPEATIEIVVTNWDPVNRVEAVPVLTSVAGT